MRHPFGLRIGSLIVGCFCAAFVATARAQQPTIAVGPNVQVSLARAHEAHGEVLMDADPTHPDDLIGCSMIFPDPLTRRLSGGITYVSSDGGAHWKPTLYVGSGKMGSGDPACGFGPDGKAYSVYLQPAVKPEMDDVLVYRSDNEGDTWNSPTHIDWIDREYITIDTTGGKYNGRIYINGTGSAAPMDFPLTDYLHDQTGISIQRSLDGGASFKPPFKRLAPLPSWVLGMGNGVVLSDGTYIAVFGEQRDRVHIADKPPYSAPNSWLKYIESTDGGDSYGNAGTIGDWYMDYGDIGTTSSIVPVIAVDRSHGPFRDRLYVVWPDYRSGRGQILLSYSSNKGKTWSAPHVVDDDHAWPPPSKGPDDVMPVVAVNREGIVGVMWYDRRDNPRNFGWWVRFAASNDGGETFSPSGRVSTAPATINLQGQIGLVGSSSGGGKPYSREKGGDIHASIGIGPIFSFNGGHTAGMAADAAGRFHPFWIDNRTGVAQVWTAAVSVAGAAMVNGSSDLANLSDVTDKVTLDFKNCQFDRAAGTVSVDAYLGNTSDVALKTPLVVRVLSLDSGMGAAAVANAGNGESGPGAAWDFSQDLPHRDEGLAPGEVSAPKRLVFRLGGIRWEHDPPSATELENFIHFEAKVLAPKPIEQRPAPETGGKK